MSAGDEAEIARLRAEVIAHAARCVELEDALARCQTEYGVQLREVLRYERAHEQAALDAARRAPE